MAVVCLGALMLFKNLEQQDEALQSRAVVDDSFFADDSLEDETATSADEDMYMSSSDRATRRPCTAHNHTAENRRLLLKPQISRHICSLQDPSTRRFPPHSCGALSATPARRRYRDGDGSDSDGRPHPPPLTRWCWPYSVSETDRPACHTSCQYAATRSILAS